jgi:hypothetical protein
VSFFRIPSPKPSGGVERAKKGRTHIYIEIERERELGYCAMHSTDRSRVMHRVFVVNV